MPDPIGKSDDRQSFGVFQSKKVRPSAEGSHRARVEASTPTDASSGAGDAITAKAEEGASRSLSTLALSPLPVDISNFKVIRSRVTVGESRRENLQPHIPVPTANLLGPEAETISVNRIADTYKVGLTGARRASVGSSSSNWAPVLESLRKEAHARLRKAMFDVGELSATDTNIALLCLRHLMDIGIGVTACANIDNGEDRTFIVAVLTQLESLQAKLADRELSFNPDREPTLQLALTHLCVGAVSIIVENLRSKLPKEEKVTIAVDSARAGAGIISAPNPLFKHTASAMLVTPKKDDDVFNALSEAAYKFLASYRPEKSDWIEKFQKRPSWIHPALNRLNSKDGGKDGGDEYTSLELFIVATQRLRQLEKAHSDISLEKLCGGSISLVLVGLFFRWNNPFAPENVTQGTQLVGLIPGPTPTSTPSSTARPSPLGTVAETPAVTPTASASGTAGETPAVTPAASASGMAGETPTSTRSLTASGTATGTPAASASGTAGETPTSTRSLTASGTAGETPTGTQSLTASATATVTPTGTQSLTASGSLSGTRSMTASMSPLPTPSATPLSCESESSDYWAFGATFQGTARMYGLATSGSGQVFGIGGIPLNGTSNNGLLIFPLGPHYGANISATVLSLSSSDLGIAGAYDPVRGRLAALSRSRNSTDDFSLVVRNNDSTWSAITWDGGRGDTASSVGFDSTGKIVFSAVARTSTGNDGVVVGRIEPSLADGWVKIIGGANSTESSKTTVVTSGSIYFAGYTYALVEQMNQETGLLGRLGLDGTSRSTHAIREMDSIWGISGEDDGLYIVGSDSSTTRGVIAKIFPQNNTVAWGMSIGNGGNFGRIFQVKETPSGILYAIGQFQNGVRFLVKVSPDGDLLNGWFISSSSSLSAWDMSGEVPVIGIERGGINPGETELAAIKLPSDPLPFDIDYYRLFDSSVQVTPLTLSLESLTLPIAPWNATHTRYTPPTTQLNLTQERVFCSLPTLPSPFITPSISPSAVPSLNPSATPRVTDSPTPMPTLSCLNPRNNWVRNIRTNETNSKFFAAGISPINGNVLLVGNVGVSGFNDKLLMVELTPDGALAAAHQIEGSTSQTAYALAMNPDGSSVIGGYTNFENYNIAILRRAANATISKQILGTPGNQEYLFGLTLHEGSVFFTGYAVPTSQSKIGVGRLNADGIGWAKTLTAGSASQSGLAVSVDHEGVAIGGYLDGGGYVAALRSSGEDLWAIRFPQVTRISSLIKTLGSIFFIGTGGSYPMVWGQLLPNGTLTYIHWIGEPGSRGSEGQIALGPDGRTIIVTGNLDEKPFLAVHHPNGTLVRANKFNLGSGAIVRALARGANSLVIAGDVNSTVPFALQFPEEGVFPYPGSRSLSYIDFPTGLLNLAGVTVENKTATMAGEAWPISVADWSNVAVSPLSSLSEDVSCVVDQGRRLGDAFGFFNPHAPSLPSPTPLSEVSGSRGLRGSASSLKFFDPAPDSSVPIRTSTPSFDIATLASSALLGVGLLLSAVFCCRRHCSTRRTSGFSSK